MRLIDADKLTPTITQWNPSALIEESYYHEEQITNAPTVDAIPTEWILRYLLDHPLNYFDSTKLYITQMIEDWRNENESTSNS